jgi:hypothetical protein
VVPVVAEAWLRFGGMLPRMSEVSEHDELLFSFPSCLMFSLYSDPCPLSLAFHEKGHCGLVSFVVAKHICMSQGVILH